MLLEDILSRAAARLPGKTALVCEGQRLSYARLDERANRLARGLAAQGIGRGDRVAIHLGNSVEGVIAIFAVLRAGGVFVAINQTVKTDKLIAVLNHCGARGLLLRGPAALPEAVQKIRGQVPSLKVVAAAAKRGRAAIGIPAGCVDFDSLTEDSPAGPLPPAHIDLDLACLIYTSGTTGQPKSVMCDHSSMLFATDAIVDYLKNSEKDVLLSVLPLSFSYGLYQLLSVFRAGATLVLENSFAYPAVILQRVAEERVTGFPGVPTIYSMLVQMDLAPYDLSSLRYLTNAAAALPPSHLLELRRRLPWTEFYSMHGLTEVVRTVYLRPEMAEKKPNSVGQAMPGTEVWLEDEAGRRLGPGQTGELVIRGRHVMRGYWGDPQGSAERFRPGPLPGERVCHSGDLFRMDEEGDFYFVSRKDDLIKSRGQKVSPREVEDVICAIPGVVEAAVVGVPDSVLGQAIKAFVVYRGSNPSAAQVLAYCRSRLEDYMIPHQVEFRKELPKSGSGKVLKGNLA